MIKKNAYHSYTLEVGKEVKELWSGILFFLINGDNNLIPNAQTRITCQARLYHKY